MRGSWFQMFRARWACRRWGPRCVHIPAVGRLFERAKHKGQGKGRAGGGAGFWVAAPSTWQRRLGGLPLKRPVRVPMARGPLALSYSLMRPQ